MRWFTLILLLRLLKLRETFHSTSMLMSRYHLNIYDKRIVVPDSIQRDYCDELQAEYKWSSLHPYERQNVVVVLLWSNEVTLAAAALLKATLVAAGHNPELVSLYQKDKATETTAIESWAIKVNLVEVIKTRYLQMRLTPDAARNETCAMASFEDIDTLRKCDFMSSGTKTGATVYIPNDLNDTCIVQHIRNSTATLDISYLERSELADTIINSDRSFFFFDTHNPSKYVTRVQFTMNQNETQCDTIIEKSVLITYDDGLLPVTFVKFSPRMIDLQRIIMIYNDYDNNDNMESAACAWARSQGKDQFKKWQKTALINLNQKRIIVAICDIEKRYFREYLHMIHMLVNYKNSSVSLIDARRMLIQVVMVNCDEDDPLHLSNLICPTDGTHLNVFSMVLTNDLVTKSNQFLHKYRYITARTYDVSKDSNFGDQVAAATGNVTDLVVALHRLLADCHWKRLIVISDETPLAAALTAALSDPASKLATRRVSVDDIMNLYGVQKLLADARVFVVNTGAYIAATVLKAAQELNMTRDNGYVWIVREYDAADAATAVIEPYSVSFSWRGERGNYKKNEREKVDGGYTTENCTTGEMSLRMKLEEKWRGRPWPLHAAQILDALIITIKEKIERITPITTEHIIQGIKENITLVNSNITAPALYVEQWGSEQQPSLVVTWRGGERGEEKCPLMVDPPPDGSTFCFMPYGDPFEQSCRDAIWIPVTVLTIIVSPGLVFMSIRWARSKLSLHDQRLETKFAKRMLARRDRVFAALADRLVARSALKLFQELGAGRFGRVHHGLLREPGRQVVVAAKTLREEASAAEESEFLREACTLAALEHENIIGFVGVCVVDGPPMLLMEHAFFGDLAHYLRERQCLIGAQTEADISPGGFASDEKAHVSASALTRLAREAAIALAYLAERGIVHRDVRAANCLVDAGRHLKLADFGLARATGTVDGEYRMCRRGVLPVLWMAPESLATGVSSGASDVWSFGVLVFELVTLGRRPYGVQPPSAVLQHVIAGGRPLLPWDAGKETRALALACWRREPEARPTAACLAAWLSTRWRALRPSTVMELIDIDKLLDDTDFDEFALRSTEEPNKALAQPSIPM